MGRSYDKIELVSVHYKNTKKILIKKDMRCGDILELPRRVADDFIRMGLADDFIMGLADEFHSKKEEITSGVEVIGTLKSRIGIEVVGISRYNNKELFEKDIYEDYQISMNSQLGCQPSVGKIEIPNEELEGISKSYTKSLKENMH